MAFVSQPFDLVYPPVDSSVPLQSVNLARELVRHGYDVTVYAPRKNAAVLHNEVDGVHYRYLSERGSGLLNRAFARLVRLLPGRRVPFHASVLSELRYTIDVALRIRAQKARIVHINSFTNFIPVIRAFNRRARLVLHMHSEWVCQMDREVMKRRVSMTDLLISCSTHFASEVTAAFPEASGRIAVVFNGVDTDFFTPPVTPRPAARRPLRLLFVGRVSPEKGIHDLLDAFVAIVGAFPDVQLDIVGPDASAPRGYTVDVSGDPLVRNLARFYDHEARSGLTYLAQLKQRMPATIAGKVNFLGGARRDEVREHYRGADVLVNPSLLEMFGGTVAEAMACGTPVVATRVGGMKDTVLDGETGFLVDPAAPGAIAAAVLRLLTDDRLREAMGARARERAVALVSWPTLGRRLAAAYDALVDR